MRPVAFVMWARQCVLTLLRFSPPQLPRDVDKGTSLSGSPSGASSLRGRKGGEKSTARLAGTWKDPGHPGCVRKVQLAGNKAFIKGADEDGKPWKAVGLISGNDVTIDFTAKGGPADVTATYVVGKGLVFPDGNVWTQ